MKKAAIYLRVSTTDQNYDRQRMELEKLVEYEGYELSYIFEEKKSAVISMDTREELTKMRQLTKADVDTIYVWDITRLSRNSIDFVNLVEEFNNKGICIYFKNERLATLTDDGKVHPMTKMQFYMLSVFAQMDAENLKAKFKSGKERALAIGNAYTGNAPYGYYIKDKHLYIDETEAEVVRMMFNYYIDGKTTREIELILNAKNISPRKGSKWSKTMITKMIKYSVYKGEPVYKNRDKNNNVINERILSAPVIIDPVIWEKAQQQKEKNKTYADKGRDRKSILRGLLVCGICGKPYQVVLTGDGFLNYMCSDKRASINTKVNCKNGGISAGYLDHIVWESIKGVYAYKSFKETFIQEKEKNQKLISDNIEQINNYIAEIVSLDKQKERIRKGYSIGIYDDTSAAEAINNVDLNISKHNQLIKELEATNLILESKVNQDFQKYNIPDIEPTYEEKRIICKELIEAAELFSYTMYKKIIQVKLKMGFVFNIFYNSNHTISKYFVIDDATATFNRPQTAPEVVKDLISDFSVTSNNNEIFDETVFGEYSFDQLWTIMKADNRLIDLPTITEDDKYLHKTKKSLSN